MAEGVVTYVAGKLLEALGSGVLREIEVARVKEEIGRLTNTVETIKAVLVYAEDKHNEENEQVKVWLGRLNDAFYDADDLLDDFATELKQRKVTSGSKLTKEVSVFFSKRNQIAYSRKMAHKTKAVRAKLEEIKNDRQFHLTEHRDEKQVKSREREQTHAFVREEMVIGRDEEKNEIIKLLLETNDVDNVSIIPIVGMGGLGKTTVAQLVFDDEQVKRHFHLRMWVCVSENFDVRVIVENIIEAATDEKPKKLQMEQLQKRLRGEIDTKKYLLVLDDIWNEDRMRWTELINLLTNGVRGSKILVTTRSPKVAEITNKHSCYIHSCYILKGLDDDKSWSLFRQTAFKNGIEPEDSKHLVEIGKQIVSKCSGVPLVIRTIGSLLYNNIAEEYWSSFKDNELSKIIKEETDIFQILKLSYDHLPSYLKQCFTYCALFPKDYEIDKQKLIFLWMAQGFLQSSQNNRCLKDVGNEYFMNLLSRSFFQNPKYDMFGNLVTCKMHNFMHDLAQLVAGVECTMTTLSTNSIHERCRHLSVDCSGIKASWIFPHVFLGEKKIRTLLLLVQSHGHYKWNDHYKMLSSCSYLRALDFGGFQFKKLSGAIGSKLKHLRYLNLSENDRIKKLPNSITKLKNLETLDLSNCDNLHKLPRNIREMVNLKDLIIEGCRSLIAMPHGIGALTNLQTLSMFVVSRRNNLGDKKYAEVEELYGLNNLKGSLTIKNLESMDNAGLANYLERMKFFQFLHLEWAYRRSESETNGCDEMVLESLKSHPNLKEIKIRYSMAVKFSSWLSSSRSLTSIALENCERCQYVPPLDQLPYLKSLYLDRLDGLEYISEEASDNCSSTQSTTFFPSLEQLTLKDCSNLKGWWRSDDDDGSTTRMTELSSFARLSKLDIQNCPNLTSMPLYPSLEELALTETSSRPLQKTMMMMNSTVGPSTSYSFSAPLSNLKSLKMIEIDDLVSLPEDGLRKCTSLLYMKIWSCPRLSQLSQGIRFLTSLQSMTIGNCEELEYLEDDEDNDDTEWQGLRSLRSLFLCGLPKLVSLPKGLQSVTSLEYLHIQYCQHLKDLPNLTLRTLNLIGLPGLVSLPEACNLSLWSLHLSELPKLASLPELETLQDLTISHCPNLKALPESMCNLPSLSIFKCPQLSIRNNKGRIGQKFHIFYGFK